MKVLSKVLFMVVLIISFTMIAEAQESLWNELMAESQANFQQGRYSEAAKVAERALRAAEETFGTNHPSVAVSMLALGRVYQAQGRYAKAKPLFKQALKIMEKALCPEHPHVAATCQNMAELYKKMGKKDEAEILEARAKKIRSKRQKS